MRTSAKKKEVVREAVPAEKQMSLFDIYPADHPVLKELAELDVSNMTPIQALNTLYELQKRLKETNYPSNGHKILLYYLFRIKLTGKGAAG